MALTVGTAAREIALSRTAGKATGTAGQGHTTTHQLRKPQESTPGEPMVYAVKPEGASQKLPTQRNHRWEP